MVGSGIFRKKPQGVYGEWIETSVGTQKQSGADTQWKIVCQPYY